MPISVVAGAFSRAQSIDDKHDDDELHFIVNIRTSSVNLQDLQSTSIVAQYGA